MIYDQAGPPCRCSRRRGTGLTMRRIHDPCPVVAVHQPDLHHHLRADLRRDLVELGDRAPSTPAKFAWALLGIGISWLDHDPARARRRDRHFGSRSGGWSVGGLFRSRPGPNCCSHADHGLERVGAPGLAGMEGQMLALAGPRWSVLMATIGAQILAHRRRLRPGVHHLRRWPRGGRLSSPVPVRPAVEADDWRGAARPADPALATPAPPRSAPRHAPAGVPVIASPSARRCPAPEVDASGVAVRRPTPPDHGAGQCD